MRKEICRIMFGTLAAGLLAGCAGGFSESESAEQFRRPQQPAKLDRAQKRPEKCPFCGRMTGAQELDGAGSCKKCREELITYRSADELPHEALEKVLKLYVPMRYSGKAKKAMLRYKFGQEEWLCEAFSRIMHNYLSTNEAYEDIDLITCVPVSPKRFAVR